MTLRHRSSWYRSFYWRLGVSFVVFVLVVLTAQSIMFSYIMARANVQNPARSPNNLATAVAADLGSALEGNPDLDLSPYLLDRYGREPWRVFVVMRNGSRSRMSRVRLWAIPIALSRSSTTWRPTRSAIRRRAGPSSSARPLPRDQQCCRSLTRARVSPPNMCPTSSIGFTKSIRRALREPEEVVWDCRLQRRSSSVMEAL